MVSPSLPLHNRHGLSFRKDSAPQELAELDGRCFDDPWRAGEYSSLMENGRVHGWALIHEESGPVGMLCFQDPGQEVEIYKIGIAPEARGRSWGRRLLETLMAEGPDQGWRGI